MIVVDANIVACDAEYVVLAKSKGIRCVTEDIRLQKLFSETAVSMSVFLGAQEKPHAVKEAPGSYRARRRR